ncbi:ATP-binding cassette domain-containing protein [Agromyces bracchium]|uniref:ATP-binding cassette domain-containing protein n=1 Tax=Agromyces bracchium TaxID=88376 RepID=A0A6I3MA99_9MICO|nr:ATP-binding cassette domain-containing protein [Agromyces bracchium]MTH70409.1 ATP-binding cassette domain-containing protein [Agromyces bracchium]
MSTENQTDRPDSSAPVLEVKKIVKTFRHVEALRGADFDVRAGEIVGLVGDNGAGKSTLIKTICGVYEPTSGEIFVSGNKVDIDSPSVARGLGIEVVYQDLGLAPDLSAVENLFLGREIIRGGRFGKLFGFLNRREMLQETNEAMAKFKLDIVKPTREVGTMSGGQQQRVSIVSAAMGEGQVLLLDEPTAALGVEARRRVNDLIRNVRDGGAGVVIISHDLPDLLEIADRIHIMRQGQRVAVLDREDFDLELIVDIMSGAFV